MSGIGQQNQDEPRSDAVRHLRPLPVRIAATVDKARGRRDELGPYGIGCVLARRNLTAVEPEVAGCLVGSSELEDQTDSWLA